MPDEPFVDVLSSWAGLQGVATVPKPASYFKGRKGYDPMFLGVEVELPQLSDAVGDDISRLDDGSFELKYHHFSTAQCASRRMPWYSACNINGTQTRSFPRVDTWSYDGRIPKEHQMLKEAYGPQNEKKFSRGHMTRRQDPNWGPMKLAEQANIDTFFATNACPQWQPFNDGLWGDLEDYILNKTDDEDLRVTVITGPFLLDGGTERHGVRVPRDFWKIVAFISEETSELSAVGYVMGQGTYLDSGVVSDFEDFELSQRPLEYIEQQSGLVFPTLREVDVLAGADVLTVQRIRRVVDTRLPQAGD